MQETKAANKSDSQQIIRMRGLRQGAYGMLAVVLAVALTQWGLSPAAIGVLVTVSLAGDFVGTLLIGHRADYWGRRRTLAALALLMAPIFHRLLHQFHLEAGKSDTDASS